MNTIEQVLQSDIKEGIKLLYGQEIADELIQLQKTRKDFKGDITIVVFPLLKLSRKSPEQTGKEIGQYLKDNSAIITDFEVVKGFLNLDISNKFWYNLRWIEDIVPQCRYERHYKCILGSFFCINEAFLLNNLR